MSLQNLTNTMICWTPRTNELTLARWPDSRRVSDGYARCIGACYAEVRAWPFERRQAQVFIEAVQMIVRDGMEPARVHEVLLDLDEYWEGCADDMPGVMR